MQERVLSLSTPLTVLKGIGPKKAEALSIDGLSTIDQLLHYYPRKYLDRTTLTLLSKLSGGQNVNVIGTIQSIKMRKGKFKYFLESIIYDGYGYLTLRWFNGAKYIKKAADNVFEKTGTNPLLDIALKLESIALSEDYFIQRNLYPNVDFYSGLIYQSMGIPSPMFTVLFTIGRTPGWLAQWKEFLNDKDQKIARPRQIYTGYDSRDYQDLESR